MDIDKLRQLTDRLEALEKAVERKNAALRDRVDSLESDIRVILEAKTNENR